MWSFYLLVFTVNTDIQNYSTSVHVFGPRLWGLNSFYLTFLCCSGNNKKPELAHNHKIELWLIHCIAIKTHFNTDICTINMGHKWLYSDFWAQNTLLYLVTALVVLYFLEMDTCNTVMHFIVEDIGLKKYISYIHVHVPFVSNICIFYCNTCISCYSMYMQYNLV